MSSLEERILIRTLHLVLSILIIGFIYGPVAHIPPAAAFTRFVAVPLVVLSGISGCGKNHASFAGCANAEQVKSFPRNSLVSFAPWYSRIFSRR
jgi:hypothetical protein